MKSIDIENSIVTIFFGHIASPTARDKVSDSLVEHLLGGWWETCSATNDTLFLLLHGTGPSDTDSWKDRWLAREKDRESKRRYYNTGSSTKSVTERNAIFQFLDLQTHLQKQQDPLFPRAGPNDRRTPRPEWGCRASWPQILSDQRERLRGTTLQHTPCGPLDPAAPRYCKTCQSNQSKD